MVRTELIGRDPELAVLGACLEEALEGHPRLALCQGEPGIGKTRLAEELLTLAARRGVPGVWAAPVDSAGAPPYWPWRQVLRVLADTVDLSAIADEHRLTGDLAGLAPELFPSCEERPHASGSTEDRFRQLDAATVLLRQLTRQHPWVIVFDDAHSADSASLLLLHHVARNLRDERLLVMVNRRDTEQGHATLFAELRRLPVTRQIQLQGLGPPAVRRQLAAVIGHDVGEAEVAQVHARTGGNPFFVGEVARLLAERREDPTGYLVTANVQEAICARMRRLAPEASRLLEAASIVGGQFPLRVVAAMVDSPALPCLAFLDEAVAAGLVETSSTPGAHRFTQALIRDAIESGLSTAERVRLHRLAAETIEVLYGDHLGPYLFDLAGHWAVAALQGDRRRAADWIERAGAAAMRSHAYEEGARLFVLALDIGAGDIDETARCRLLLGLAAARHLSSDLSGGLQASLEAAAVARAIGRPDLVAEAALVMEPTFDLEVNLAIRVLCEQAMAGLGPEHTSVLARVAARLAEVCHYLGDVEPARPASEDVLALAEHVGDPVAVVAALHARQLVCSGPDDLAERAALAERMLDVGRRSASPDAQMWGHLWRVDVAFERGHLASVATELHAAAGWAHEVGGRLARWQVLRAQAVLAQAQARFDDARRLGDEAFTTLAPTGNPIAPMIRGGLLSAIAHHVGHDAESVAANGLAGPQAVEEHSPAPGVIQTLAGAQVLTEVGRLHEAAARYRSLGPVADWRPTAHAALCSYATGIAVAVALRAGDDVATLRHRLDAYRGHHVVSGAGQVGYFGPVELWLGVAASHLDLLDEAVADLHQAVKACESSGAAGHQIEAQYELALVLARRDGFGEASRARSLATSAAKQATVLGMTAMAARATRLAEQPHAASSLSVLTPREHEVAELVAQGLTNREIAARLYLSERTAQNHVQNILNKLHLPNRGQIAVWTTRQK